MTTVRSEDVDFDVDAFLARPLMAHLATTSPQGPRDSPVWFLWEEGAIWLIGTSNDSFPQRLLAEPRCAIGVVHFDLARGVLLHLGMRGVATVLPMDRARRDRLLRRYLGDDESAWNATFRETVIEPLDRMIRFVPETVVARDQSYFK
ncbi:pyridoxamine 5'-phosphate oxidase family protein [Pendulispora rubella]|uniref:Pyridoxamine 5'-phosphate oxidase family protein n=1 Tax=Pendulispora rubella TaxID=2741070 RepID=A0ABZ2L5R3_9BACT